MLYSQSINLKNLFTHTLLITKQQVNNGYSISRFFVKYHQLSKNPIFDEYPIFNDCFDWHSSVYGHMEMLRLSRLTGSSEGVSPYVVWSHIRQNFTTEKINQETELISSGKNQDVYGMAWGLMLAKELLGHSANYYNYNLSSEQRNALFQFAKACNDKITLDLGNTVFNWQLGLYQSKSWKYTSQYKWLKWQYGENSDQASHTKAEASSYLDKVIPTIETKYNTALGNSTRTNNADFFDLLGIHTNLAVTIGLHEGATDNTKSTWDKLKEVWDRATVGEISSLITAADNLLNASKGKPFDHSLGRIITFIRGLDDMYSATGEEKYNYASYALKIWFKEQAVPTLTVNDAQLSGGSVQGPESHWIPHFASYFLSADKDWQSLNNNTPATLPEGRIEHAFFGSSKTDVLDARYSYHANSMYGFGGDDWLLGNNYANYMDGGKGADKLYGFGGNDRHHGGAGGDTFFFTSGIDVIEDFNAREIDKINLGWRTLSREMVETIRDAGNGVGQITLEFSDYDKLTIDYTNGLYLNGFYDLYYA